MINWYHLDTNLKYLARLFLGICHKKVRRKEIHAEIAGLPVLCFNALKLPPLRVFRPQITASQMTRIRLRYIRHQVGEVGNGGGRQ